MDLKDLDIKTRFNGKPAAIVRVSRTSEQDIIEIATRLRADYVENLTLKVPENVDFAVWGNFINNG